MLNKFLKIFDNSVYSMVYEFQMSLFDFDQLNKQIEIKLHNFEQVKNKNILIIVLLIMDYKLAFEYHQQCLFVLKNNLGIHMKMYHNQYNKDLQKSSIKGLHPACSFHFGLNICHLNTQRKPNQSILNKMVRLMYSQQQNMNHLQV